MYQLLEQALWTNSIDRNEPDEAGDWFKILGISANDTEAELLEEHKTVINTLEERAKKNSIKMI